MPSSEYDSATGERYRATMPLPADDEALPLQNISASAHNSISPGAEQPPSHRRVKLPALADPAMADDLISVNFDQADIRDVLKTVGDITGINFVLDDNVRGAVTVMSPTKIRLGDLYEILESILEVNGYAAVPSGDWVKIIPRADAATRNHQVRVGSDPSEIPGGDTLVTQIIPIRYADVTEMAQIVRSFLPAGSYMAAYPKTNSILITDTSANIRFIAEIVQKLDVRGLEQQVTVIGLKYASAEVLSEQVVRIMEKSKLTALPPGRSREMPQMDMRFRILPDARTNSLIVVADAKNTEMIESLANQLDIQRPRGTNNVHVVYLKNAPAKETAQSLTSALTDLRIAGAVQAAQRVLVTADEGTNALIITASKQDFETIAEIIEKLDIVREQVSVEMLLVEVGEDSLREIGIDWATLDEAVAGSIRAFGATNFGPRVDFASGDLEGLAVGAWTINGDDLTIGPILHALEKIAGVNILSRPHLTTSNHQKARVVVGENRPFVTGERITENDPVTPTVIRTFDYRDVGIKLELTPHISQGGLVRLEIDSEFTKLIETLSTPSINTPTTAKRQAQTVVSMNSGSTIVIGGLIRDDKLTVEKRIPFVSDIPLIGGLFKHTREQLQKTNLLIFITPRVLGTQQDLEKVTEQKRQEIQPALEKLETDSGL
jgi:general secretion pathway protein D